MATPLAMFLAVATPPSTYTTTFPADENPISEGGQWARAANAMTNVRTVSGNAYGTQIDNTYDDSYAILQGDWGVNYEIEGVIYRHPSLPDSADPSHEVELWLRASDGADTLTCYEIMFTSWGNVDAFPWMGPIDPRGSLGSTSGSGYGSEILDGDVIKARIVGTTITAWVNGQLAHTWEITSFSPQFNAGNPGIGFFTRPALGGHSEWFGLKSLTIAQL